MGQLAALEIGTDPGRVNYFASVFLRPVDLPTRRITARERYSTNLPT